MSGNGDSEDRPRRTPSIAESPREKVLRLLQAARDNLCVENASAAQRQADLYAAGYGAGVEAMWEAAEDLIKLPVAP
jgi:hypothetical protein